MLKNMKVSVKLILGFSLVLIITIVIAIEGLLSLSNSSDGFVEYRELAREANIAGRIQANLLESRLDGKKFLETGSQEALQSYNSASDLFLEIISDIDDDLFTEGTQIQQLEKIKDDFIDYDEYFNQVVELYKNKNEILGILTLYGNSMLEDIDIIMDETYEDGNYEASFYSAELLENSITVRLNTARYLVLGTEEEYQSGLALFGNVMDDLVANLRNSLNNQIYIDHLNDYIENADQYEIAFIDLHTTNTDLNNIVDTYLDIIGPAISDDIEDIKLDIQDIQNNLGPRLIKQNQDIMQLVIITSIVALVLAIIIIIVITLSITNTLGGEPNFLADVAKQVSDGKLDINWGAEGKSNKGLLANIKRMVESLRSKARNIEKIAEGNFNVNIELASNEDVVGKALLKMSESLNKKSKALEKIANGDFTVHVEMASNKDVLGRSMKKMVKSINNIFKQINHTVTEVKAGADQLSNSSQDLSEGASDQASSLEEVSASLSEVSSQIQTNSENVIQASQSSQKVKDYAQNGFDKMQELVTAIKDINDSAEQIRNIVKVIDDIAFQTNLLALNANIEAARVGKYGKGFAVVANSVRSLATESAESVKETTAQVEKVLSSIETGNVLVNETAKQFNEIVERAVEVNNLVSEVATASQEQTRGIEQISTALNQVENVVQSNTANAEENASTSEELASQATELGNMMLNYRFNEDREIIDIDDDYDEIRKLPADKLKMIMDKLENEENSDLSNNDEEKNLKPYNPD
jgi:methyl-accepting chemotaxis protein